MNIKTYLGGIALGAITFLVPGCGQGQTNNPTVSTNKIVWVATNDERLVRHGNSDTNGLNCALTIGNYQGGIGLATPTCIVDVYSTTTNRHDACWRHYPKNYLEIDLLDSSGNPVSRTTVGKGYEHFIDQKQVQAAFLKAYDRSHRSTVQGFGSVSPMSVGQFATISLPELFDLKEPGEYTLKVRMRLLEIDLAKRREGKFTITPLPEVVAKIQIQKLDQPTRDGAGSK